MDWRAQCAAVIPCLNEAPSIAQVVQAVRRQLPSVFVVDDGSTDATSACAQQAGATVFRHHTPCGKGAALQTGWQQARAQGFDWALTLDGDGQHTPEAAPLFFHCAESSGAQLIVGNRMTQAQRMPWLRRAVNRWMSRQLSRVAGQALPDSQCGFRLISLGALAGVRLAAQHFEIESEMLLAFIQAGQKVEFVEVPAVYGAQRSKIHPLRDTWRWWRWWRTAR